MPRAMKTAAILLLFTFAVAQHSRSLQTSVRSTAQARAGSSSARFDVRQALGTSASVLLDVIRSGSNPIPLAVLNATKCVAFINSKGAADALGIVSCRLSPNEWTGPAFVSLHQNDAVTASRKRELLVLLMSEKAKDSLLGGRLTLGEEPASSPGPLSPRQANLQESEIKVGTFTYDRGTRSSLASESIDGTITPDDATTRELYSGKTGVRPVLSGHAPVPKYTATYVNAVGSFFNTITPSGIIIHHSAALPSDNRVPTSERQVDRFHQARGFAVACFGRTYHVAYHYLIWPTGKIEAGRPENCQGAHAHGYNSYLGISLAGDFSSVDNPNGKKGPTQPSGRQMKSLYALCRRLMKRYHIPPKRILRHSDISNTRCPGDRFPYSTFIARLGTVKHRRTSGHRS
jgi:N-acetylmuramoyl-L-alanine amidase